MMQRVSLEPAFVLHRRYYRNTSLIIDLLTLNHGRVSALARSARGLKSRYKGRLELFFPLLVSWVGRSDLKLLGDVELNGMPYLLEGKALLCGFYLNELLIRLLYQADPFHRLFYYYQQALSELMEGSAGAILRCFEKRLLDELGYGLPLHPMKTDAVIEANGFYQYRWEQGFLPCEKSTGENVFSGKCLLALKEECFHDQECLIEIKRLMRLIFSRLLGERGGIKTRVLFR